MAKHDLPRMSATRRYDLEPAPGKKDGCKCEICGSVFLWRSKVKPFEIQADSVESALSMDRIASANEGHPDHTGRLHGAHMNTYGYWAINQSNQTRGHLNLNRQLSDGRGNQDLIQCTLCYEAPCSSCQHILHLQDYLWANCCRYCGADLLPVFSRRSPPQGDAMVKLQEPIHLSLCDNRTIDVTTDRLVMPIEAKGPTIYEVPIEFQCRCCRYCFGGYFHYLSWELGDNWRMTPEGWAHLVISRDDYLCIYCRTGDGLPGFCGEKAIFCKCVGSARVLSKIYPWQRRRNAGWVVDNPDMPEHKDARVRRYVQKQYARHNDEKERAYGQLFGTRYTRPCWALQRLAQPAMISNVDDEPDCPPIGHKLLTSMGKASSQNPDLPD